MGDSGIAFEGLGKVKVGVKLVGAEVGELEQLLNQDDLRAACSGLAHQFFDAGNIGGTLPVTRGRLQGGYGYITHGDTFRLGLEGAARATRK